MAKGTVSRCLNGYDDVSPATRARVLAAATELGYRPSSVARNLRRGRVDTVGVVLSTGDGALWRPHLAQFIDGVSRGLAERGLDMLLATCPSGAEAAACCERLEQTRKVDAFIVMRTESHDPRIDYLRRSGALFVAHGRTADCDDFAWFDIDNAGAFRKAALELATLGHRRIALIGGSNRLNFARARLEGYLQGLAEAGLEADPALRLSGGLNEIAGHRGARRLMALPAPPTALICIVDAVAIGAMRALRDLGLRIGREVSVIGYDGVPYGDLTDPPLSTFQQRSLQSGAKTAALLTRLMDGENPIDLQTLEPADFVSRESHGPPAISSAALGARLREDAPKELE